MITTHLAWQAFDPADRPTCEEALSDPYFHGLAQPQREPAAQPVSKLAFDFERRKLHTEEVGSGFRLLSESWFVRNFGLWWMRMRLGSMPCNTTALTAAESQLLAGVEAPADLTRIILARLRFAPKLPRRRQIRS